LSEAWAAESDAAIVETMFVIGGRNMESAR